MTKPKSKQSSGRRKAGHLFARKDEAVKWFQRDGFEPSELLNLVQSERELVQAQHELSQLNEYCKQEVQKVVHAHHKDFLEASRDIQELEAVIDELRNYVSGSAAVVANLEDLPQPTHQSSSAARASPVASSAAEGLQGPWEGVLVLQAELMQELQVAVAEQDFSLARALLSAGRDMIAVVERDQAQLNTQVKGDGISAWRYNFEGALASQKAALVGALQNQLAQSSISMQERRQAAQTLSLLVGPSQAAQALLRCHSMLVRAAQQQLLKQHSAAGGDPDGVEYAGGLAQRTFLAIGAAAEDVRAVFPAAASATSSSGMEGVKPSSSRSTPAPSTTPDPSGIEGLAAVLPTVSALLVQWAADEARQCAGLMCRHALMPFTATGMAVGALLCVGLALVFCVALESTHGLALRMVFQDELWPLVEAIVRRHLHRLQEEAVATTSVDATNAALQSFAGSGAAPSSGPSPAASGSANLTRDAIALLGLVKDGGGGTGSGQVAPSFLLPTLQLPTHTPTPTGLASLRVLVPELRALADGLAPLASVPAVAVLRQGVLSVYGALCSTVHSSVARLAANIGSAGKDAAANGPLLAAYVAKVEGQLRKFAELDVQVALAPLSTLAGPVAPPDMLLPALTPLTDLLASLPPPAPERTSAVTAAAAGPEPSPQQLLSQASTGGLMERIRAELEAEQERLDRDREGRRIRDMPSAASEASAAAGATAPPGEAERTQDKNGVIKGAVGQPRGEGVVGRRQVGGGVEGGLEPLGAPAKPMEEPPGRREGGGWSVMKPASAQTGGSSNRQDDTGDKRQQRAIGAGVTAPAPPVETAVSGKLEGDGTDAMPRRRRSAGLPSYQLSSDEDEERTRQRPPRVPRRSIVEGQGDGGTRRRAVPDAAVTTQLSGPNDVPSHALRSDTRAAAATEIAALATSSSSPPPRIRGRTRGQEDAAREQGPTSSRTKEPVAKQPSEELGRKQTGATKGGQAAPDSLLEGGEGAHRQVGGITGKSQSLAPRRRFRQPSPPESDGSGGEEPSRAAARDPLARTQLSNGSGGDAQGVDNKDKWQGVPVRQQRERLATPDALKVTVNVEQKPQAPRGALQRPPREQAAGRMAGDMSGSLTGDNPSGVSWDARRAPQTAAAQQRLVDSSPDRPPPAPSEATRPTATGRSGAVPGLKGEQPVYKSTPDAANTATAGGGGRKANRFGVVLSDDEDVPELRPRVARQARGSSLATGGLLSTTSEVAVAVTDDAMRGATGGALMPGHKSDEHQTVVGTGPSTERRRRVPIPDVGEPTSRPTKAEAPDTSGPSRAGTVVPDAGAATGAGAKVLTARERLAARMAAKEAQHLP